LQHAYGSDSMVTTNFTQSMGIQDDASLLGWTPLLDALPQGVMLIDSEGRYLPGSVNV